jgi:hypothetical protein
MGASFCKWDLAGYIFPGFKKNVPFTNGTGFHLQTGGSHLQMGAICKRGVTEEEYLHSEKERTPPKKDSMCGALKAKDAADLIIVTTDGDHTSVEVIFALIHIYRRDIQCLNKSVMDTIIICPEAVIVNLDGSLKVEIEWRFMLYVYLENNL